ncbi:MAG: V/A-type H+/Na+-transporting ATPase subunit [Sphaerochaeta sp.]|uniref:ATPase n=1 Tax=Sphaerochaeta halotolerans TaxID=2293840 RepID=A0A372MGI6_9SPIR|nr:V-type ATPase 116kDa subunit family protein [Sphaerochaeta halotolerans]MBG0767411.1 ATPase [Spirochaetaceae bacterium]MDK2859647.1 V/A-type H+/Na+-transporting ATPase subunit [Sphaerochaeta sp.]MDN5334049.1 V/A-type H+/Na+-transporting ATPase subunit [Sphaerochaeta sp.]RFU94872.1 ATPase [Sphaerochaeta halotolerans]
MNLFTRPMKLLTAVVLEQTSDRVVKSLLRLGVLDFVHINKLDPGQMEKLSFRQSSVSRSALQDMRHRVEALLKQGHITVPTSEVLDVQNLEKPQLEAFKKTLDDLTASLLSLKEKQKESNQMVMGLEEMQRYIKEDKGEYLDLRVGQITKGRSEDLKEKIAAFGGLLESVENTDLWISLTLRRDVGQVDPLLEKFGWMESSDVQLQQQAISMIKDQLGKEHDAALAEREKIEKAVDEMVSSQQAQLFAIWANLRLNELSDQIRSYFAYTRNTTLFSGWVPTDQAEVVEQAIIQASEGQCVIEWTDARQVPRNEVPVAVSSPKILAPFQRMVNNYSTPEYGSVNPTIFVMIAYLCMFGLMFADVGQGLVLLLVALLGKYGYKKNPLKKDGMISRNLTDLLIYLGISAMIFGALFGSYFGLSLFPAIWFNYEAVVAGHGGDGSLITDVYDILGLTVKFGIIVIYTGLVLNWINLFRKKSYLQLTLDKNGLLGGVLFGTGLYMGFAFVESGYQSFPSDPWIAPVLAVSLFLLLIRGFLAYYISVKQGGKRHDLGTVTMDAILEWFIDILEIFTGYLSNTLSFMRVAGLGIAHASLMQAFKELSSLVDGFGGVVIFILGNILVIVLEGLSSGIQSLRLNYYEFFSRYFTGKGVAYQPVGLKNSSSEQR